MPTCYIWNSSAFHRNLNVFTQIYFGPHLDTEVFQHFVSCIWKIDCKRPSVTRVCDMLVNQLPCMFPSNAWAFIFCHFWQIAEHTHIFSLPLPHKLWLHMGKHRLPQGCSKRRPTPRTHSQDSRTGSRRMVSASALWVVRLSRGLARVRESITGVALKDSWATLESVVPFDVYILTVTVSNERCENWWLLLLGAETNRSRGSSALSLSFYSVSISTLNLPFERLALAS